MKKVIVIISLICIVITSSFLVYAKQNILDFNGYIVFVDAGHGGKDNGASYDDVLEDSINLSISKFIVSSLVDKGAIVLTSRDDDYDLASNYDKNRKAKDLKKRVELINMYNPDLFVSIHLNTFPNEAVYGGQVFAQDNEDSRLLATSIQNRFNEFSKTNKKIKMGNYYILNKSNPVGVIIECGFLTNHNDRVKLLSEEYQKEISEEIVEGIYEFLVSKN